MPSDPLPPNLREGVEIMENAMNRLYQQRPIQPSGRQQRKTAPPPANARCYRMQG